MKLSKLTLIAFVGALISCAHENSARSLPAYSSDALLSALSLYCGKSFAGTIIANEPEAPDDSFVGKTLNMHVRDCSASQFKVPFHVGTDHSRTWEFTVVGKQLQLKHEHRHADGELDELTDYGGTSTRQSSANRAEFPVDAASKALFDRTGRPVSMTNVWAVEITQDQQFIYELTRPGRVFRVAFDLTMPVKVP